MKDDLARESSSRAFGKFENEREVIARSLSFPSIVGVFSSLSLDKVYFSNRALCVAECLDRVNRRTGGIFRDTLYEAEGAVLKKTTIESRLKIGRTRLSAS